MSTLSRLASGRQKYGLSRFVVREANTRINKLLFRLDRRSLVAAFESIGAAGDKTVCVHASLSRLGYIDGGAEAVVDALLESVGKSGCILMPSFPLEGTMLGYLESGSTFDVRTTPARTGAITEAFRRRERVIRSLHPTNSVAAYGRRAAELLRDHEKSTTPYGYATPYGRLAEDENAYILMLDTHVHSLLHHIQERVGFPNLFLDGEREAEFVDYDGIRRRTVTKVMRPLIPYFVAVQSPSGEEPEWVILHDFALMFPPRRRKDGAALGYTARTIEALEARRRSLIASGTLRARRLGRGVIGLLHVASFVRSIQPELEESIEKFRAYYDVSYLETKRLRFG